MLTELNRRFSYIFDEYSDDFDGSFLLATALDPNLRQYLSEEFIEKMRYGLKETLQSVITRKLFIYSKYTKKKCNCIITENLIYFRVF